MKDDEAKIKPDSEKAASDLLREMEGLGAKIRSLILRLPPLSLLGYLSSRFLLNIISRGEDARPDKDLIGQIQFVSEYAHATWAANSEKFEEGQLDELIVTEVLALSETLKTKSVLYCMLSSHSSDNSDFGEHSAEIEFHAKSSWVLIRGNRYQVLEEEFFAFALAPHSEALIEAYGVSSDAIARGIQDISDSHRAGYMRAVESMENGQNTAKTLMKKKKLSLKEAMAELNQDPAFVAEMSGAMRDMFFGGTHNVSRHSQLPLTLLSDLAFIPGQESEFFSDGPFCGTPLRTLPVRIKPLIKLADEFYSIDGQFIRDAAYRAIQRNLIQRLPNYREEWNRRQKEITETAFSLILDGQLGGGTSFTEVYFKEVGTGNWVETDSITIIDDVMVIVEAKAGVGVMGSPSTNYQGHVRAVKDLVIKAHSQCNRFISYLASADEVPIFSKIDGRYVEQGRLKKGSYRKIFPVGLTMESFSPFSSMCKVLPEVAPILGSYPFISMSVDDLFVLRRFLQSTGEFFHYLDVRQEVAGIPEGKLFDELDHLGAYIAKNRVDMTMRDQLREANLLLWDSFSDVVDEYFEGLDWQKKPVPAQKYSARLISILQKLDELRPVGWLWLDSHIRNLSDEGRENLKGVIEQLLPSLSIHPRRRVLFGDENPVQIWLHSRNENPSEREIVRQGEIACLFAKAPIVPVLILEYEVDGTLLVAGCRFVKAPLALRAEYPELVAEAKRQGARAIQLNRSEKNS